MGTSKAAKLHAIFTLPLCALSLLIVGCTSLSVDFSNVSSRNSSPRIPLNVALVLAPGLGKTTEMGDLENLIRQYAQSVSKQAFEKVSVVGSASEAVATGYSILTPQVIKVRYILPTSGYDDSRLEIVMDWTLKARDNKDIVWMQTIAGSAEHPFGPFNPTKHLKILVQMAFEDLYAKTLDAVQRAPEFRQSARQ
jgi:hypothetical protein